jgi:putative copper export protein
MLHQSIIMWIHLLAAVIWVGGMAFLAFVLGPYGRRLPDDQRAELFQSVGRRFSRISWPLIVILIITGPLSLYFRGVPPADAFSPLFLSTYYGQAILIKAILFILIIVLSAAHDFLIGPRVHDILAGLRSLPEEQRQEARERALRMRRTASYIGRVNFILALAILYFAASLAV